MVLLAAALACAGCAPGVKRIGYAKPAKPAPECEVRYVRPAQVSGQDLKKLGTVKLIARGLALECSEYVLLDRIGSEACALGGNLAVIRNGDDPNPQAVCYRLEADLYRVDSATMAGYGKDRYDEPFAMSRRSQDFGTRSGRELGLVMGTIVFILVTGPLIVGLGLQ
jgi:hypothetical protein